MSDLTIKPAALDVKPLLHKVTGKLALGVILIDSDGQRIGRLLLNEDQAKAFHDAIGRTLGFIETLNAVHDTLKVH